jgi:hypothetical protein
MLLYCAVIARIVLRNNSRFGASNSRLRENKFPFSRRRELARKRLSWLVVFGVETVLSANNRENSLFHGNNRELRARRNVRCLSVPCFMRTLLLKRRRSVAL